MRTDTPAIAGRTSGDTMRQKTVSSPAPSTRAASSASSGMSRMKLRMNSVQKPVWNAMWNRMSAQRES